MKEKQEFYKKYFNIPNPYKHQIKIWENIENFKFPVLLRVPTGSGKTEAVLAPFFAQFIKNEFFIAPRLIYVLPMRVLVNSIAERIEKYAKKVSPYISIKIQHGDLPGSPFFIGDIIVTTLDQFVYGFARASKEVGHHIDMPAGAIASSMVVFDEAHMYRDGFTFSIMRAVMEILYHTNIPFVVMTATMPESLENSLFENIKDYRKIIGKNVVNSKIKIKISKKPIYCDGKVNISKDLLKKIKNKKTLIVLNQVKRAQEVYNEIKRRLKLSSEEIVLLHSRFTRIDRAEHERKALSLIPHKENGKIKIPKGIGIVVSTQVLEAGIDFSAKLLLTELAPADALVQRAGRCARYKGEAGEMIIFPVEDDGYKPYEKRHLEKTLEWLKKHTKFNIKNFKEVSQFVNETLDYSAKDYEAVDTLIDLYECVLYADTNPENIQIRKDKSAKVIVVEPKIGERRRESKEEQLKNGVRDILKNHKLNDFSFDVDIKTLWKWFKDGILKYELRWNENEKGKYEPDVVNLKEREGEITEEDRRISPFKTYIIESSYYTTDLGVTKDESQFI
ncbi:CRISPR-associated helicase Cas3' [Thermodesulfovibrio sp. TK110]